MKGRFGENLLGTYELNNPIEINLSRQKDKVFKATLTYEHGKVVFYEVIPTLVLSLINHDSGDVSQTLRFDNI